MEPDGIETKKLFSWAFPGLRLNRSLRILITTSSIFLFAVGLFSPFYAVFVQHIGGSLAFAGLSWAVFSIIAGILIFLFSRWELKVKEQELLIALGYLLRAGVFLSYAFMASMAQLIITQIFWGVAMALSAPAFDSVFASHTSKENSIIEWGALEGIYAIVSGVAALAGGLAIAVFGFEAVFMVMAVLCLGLGIYIWKLPREVL